MQRKRAFLGRKALSRAIVHGPRGELAQLMDATRNGGWITQVLEKGEMQHLGVSLFAVRDAIPQDTSSLT